jgi:hypothetical protein
MLHFLSSISCPLNTAGKVLGSVTMVFGIMIMALPVSILTQNFTEYDDNIYHHVIRAGEDEYDENAVSGSGSFSSFMAAGQNAFLNGTINFIGHFSTTQQSVSDMSLM